MSSVEPVSSAQRGVPWSALITTTIHGLIFIVFYSQEILVDSSACEITCGSLPLDLVLIVLAPVSWIVAVTFSALALRKRPRSLAILCLSALALPLVALCLSALGIP